MREAMIFLTNDINEKTHIIIMQDFAAIDFETANYCRSSVCSVGVVIVRGGEVSHYNSTPKCERNIFEEEKSEQIVVCSKFATTKCLL